ncbi:MAG: hemolysin family protein [Bdellovibrionales bacterium]
MGTLIFLIVLSCALSFICAILEAVLLSTTPSFIAMAVKNGHHYGVLLERLKSNINRPISAILSVNTLANTVGGALVGAQVIQTYGDKFLAMISGIATVFFLIFGELAPKVLGASNWKSLAPICAYLINVLIYITYPFVWLSEKLSKLVGAEPESAVSREEVIVTAEMGADEGTIRPKESAIIRNLLMLDKMKVADIMTPRSVIYAFESGTMVSDVMAKNKPIRFSRIPIYKEDLDHILGVVHRYKILEAASHDHDSLLLDSMMTPVHTVPENISVAAALDQFIKRHEHIFLAIDDYGSTTGIVSLEDAIETLLGVEIVDEFDSVADLRQLALDQWRERKQKLQNAK